MKINKKLLLKNISLILIPFVPIATIVSCSSSVTTINWDKNKELVDNVTGEKFLQKTEDLGIKEVSILNDLEYRSSFFLYAQEQKGSVELQKLFFEWEIFSLKQQIFGIKYNANSPSALKEKEKKSIDNKEKEINKILKKIKKIKNKNIEYSSGSFRLDYPKIIIPQSKIMKNKADIFKDEKDNFIEQFTTEADGKEQWPKNRRDKYNGATTDEEAKEYLVFQETQAIAFSRFSFKLNNSFTKEMAQAIKISGTNDNLTLEPIFPFLRNINVQFKSPIEPIPNDGSATQEQLKNYQIKVFEDKDKLSNAYFVSSNTKMPSELEKINKYVEQGLSTQKIIQVQNIMLPGKQDEKNPQLPWNILIEKPSEGFTNKSSIKRILYKYTKNNIGARDLAQNLFMQKYEEKTSDFVQYFSNTLDDTRTKSGKLGIQLAIQYVEQMVPAFGFGILKILGDPKSLNSLPNIKLNDILGAYNKGLDALLKEKGITDFIYSNTEIDRIIDGTSDDKLNNIFGEAIRVIFDKNVANKKGINLVYKVNLNNSLNNEKVYIVISEEFGIHMININSFTDDWASVQEVINKDLENLAENQLSQKDSTTSIWNIYTKYFNRMKKLKTIIDITDDKKTLIFEEYFKKNYKNIKKAPEILKDAKSLIQSSINAESTTIAKNAIGDKIKSWYLKKIDEELRREEIIIDVNNFYKWAYKLAGGK